MGQVDSESLLDRLGVDFYRKSGDELFSYCPDHHLYVNRRPSHPKWYLNTKTGKTHCFTEGRGSNIVFTIARLRECSTKEAIKWMLGVESEKDVKYVKLKSLAKKLKKLQEKDDTPNTVALLHDIAEEVENGTVYDTGYEFFINPAGKKPTNILPETVDHFKVFERKWGYYTNRVIIPFFQKKELVGFCAVDTLGVDEWKTGHPGIDAGNYKKVLYPKGFSASECLFGYDEVKKGSPSMIITEGPREVMKLWQEGFRNSVAVLGSSLSDGQVRLISELFPKEIVLMFDGDVAGYEATNKAAKRLADFFDVYVVVLPLGTDPKHLDKKEMGRLVANAKKFHKSLDKK
jgi:DNA primase